MEIAYKGFDKYLKCNDFQYEVGKKYTIDEPIRLCERGFHACRSPLECFNYYSAYESRYCLVKLSGQIIKSEGPSTKMCASEITILKELTYSELISEAHKWTDANANVHLKYTSESNTSEPFIKIHSEALMPSISAIGHSNEITSNGGVGGSINTFGAYNSVMSSSRSENITVSGQGTTVVQDGIGTKITVSGSSSHVVMAGLCASVAVNSNDTTVLSSGNRNTITTNGNMCLITSNGENARITIGGNDTRVNSSGDVARITSLGCDCRIKVSGDSSRVVSSGDFTYVDCTGKDSVIVCTGKGSRVKASAGSWVTMAAYKFNNETDTWYPSAMKTIFVDGEVIKGDTWFEMYSGNIAQC